MGHNLGVAVLVMWGVLVVVLVMVGGIGGGSGNGQRQWLEVPVGGTVIRENKLTV